jgi:hypothetical protein
MLLHGTEQAAGEAALAAAALAWYGHAVGDDDQAAQNATSQGSERRMAEWMMPTML